MMVWRDRGLWSSGPGLLVGRVEEVLSLPLGGLMVRAGIPGGLWKEEKAATSRAPY